MNPGYTSLTMRCSLVRLFAVVLLLGQVVRLSGGALCGLRQSHHAQGCAGDMPMAGGPVVAPAQNDGGGTCALLGPCAPAVPAMTGAPIAALSVAESTLSAGPVTGRPLSFNPTPVPPPPQA